MRQIPELEDSIRRCRAGTRARPTIGLVLHRFLRYTKLAMHLYSYDIPPQPSTHLLATW